MICSLIRINFYKFIDLSSVFICEIFDKYCFETIFRQLLSPIKLSSLVKSALKVVRLWTLLNELRAFSSQAIYTFRRE